MLKKFLFVLLFIPLQVFASQQGIIKLTNAERVKNHMPVLKENKELNKAAMLKAKDMIKNNYWSHTSPKGVTPWYWFDKAGYDYKYAGENLAKNFSCDKDVIKAWMKSRGHKSNILDKDFKEIGVAEVKWKKGLLIVQVFGTEI